MINLADKITAKTVNNILANSVEIEYQYGDENLHSDNTVANSLNGLNDEIINKVNIGEIVGNPTNTWEQGTVEQYVDDRVNELNAEINRKLAAQQLKLNTLNGNECEVVDSLPQSGSVGVVYRVPNDPDGSHYSDYMWDTSTATPAFKKLATYSFPGVDEKPTSGSTNFVESGGVFDEIVLNSGAFDLTAYNSGETYSTLSNALAAMNINELSSYRKGGMSIRYVQSSDNKYVRFDYMGTSVANADFSNLANWKMDGTENVVLQSASSVEIHPNVFNVWGEVASLAISFAAGISGYVNEYMFQFTCPSSAATTLTLPGTIKWANDDELEPEAGYTYQISIIDNLAVYAGWEGVYNE